jgi:two-component system chemotaxis sensor kinase CheA
MKIICYTTFFVEECIELTSEIKKINGRNLINVRGEIVLYPLRKTFKIYQDQPDLEQIVVINENKTKVGFVVDEIIGQHQTVIKTLGSYYKHVELMSGATVMGDGRVALIIDIPRLINTEIIEEKLLVENYG